MTLHRRLRSGAASRLALAVLSCSTPLLYSQCFDRMENPGGGNWFSGYALEIEGDRAVISSEAESWVFERHGAEWQRIGRVPARSGRISGDRVITGQRGASPRVWRRDGDDWTLEGTLNAPGAGRSYGQYFAISGDCAAVSEHDANRVEMFEHDGTSWSHTTTLTGGSLFGWTIEMDGDRLLVGEPTTSGSAHIFRRVDGEWELEQRLLQPPGGGCSFFGTDVSISGHTVAIGTSADFATNAQLCGHIFIFELDETTGTWEHTATTSAPTSLVTQRYGRQLDLDGDYLVASTFAYRGEGGSGIGAAFVYRRVDGAWQDLGQHAPEGIDNDDEFGALIATSAQGNVLISGGGDDRLGQNRGAVYSLSFGPDLLVSGLDAESEVDAELALEASRDGVPAEDDDATYSWDFGDGVTGEGRSVSHAWSVAGIYNLHISAVGSDGSCSRAERRLIVRCPGRELVTWSAADVGEPLLSGSAAEIENESGGTDLFVCAGGDLVTAVDRTDELYHVYREVEGDFVLSARVGDGSDWPGGAFAGLMIREDAGAGARHVALGVSSSSSATSVEPRLFSISRDEVDTRIDLDRTTLSNPVDHVWLVIQRNGPRFAARYSLDGITWEEVGAREIDLPPTLRVGVGANAAHRDLSAAASPAITVTFEDVMIGPVVPIDTDPLFVRGDANTDAVVDLSDAVRVLGYLFLGSSTPTCLEAADSDDSGVLDLTDGVTILNHLFLGAAPPSAPYPECGVDPTEDGLGCESFVPCD